MSRGPTRVSWRAVACCAALAAIGCGKSEPASGAGKDGESRREPPPAAPAPARPAPARPASPSPTAAASAAAAAPLDRIADDGLGDVPVEVEIFGTIAGRPKTGKVVVYVAAGDCLADDAAMLGHVAGGASFMIEVFAASGTKLTVCAAVDPGTGKPAVRYGKWNDPLLAEGEGEVVYRDIAIELAKGKPHVFPAAPAADR